MRRPEYPAGVTGESDNREVLRPGNVVLDSRDPGQLAGFWAALTGYQRRELFGPYAGLVDPSGRGPNLTFQRVEAPAHPPGRCHVDFYVSDPDGAAVRATALGGRLVRRVAEGDVHWVVLADPEGNEFCFVAAIGPERRP